MKAIILAAGEGKRLRPLTEDRPKCMVPYKGKPIIDYILKTFSECGIDSIGIVSGYRKEVLEEYLKNQNLRFFFNELFASTNMVHTLFKAESFMDDDLVISYADIIYKKEVLTRLVNSKENISVVVDKNWKSLWQERMEDPLIDAETMKIKNGNIIELGKKPESYADIEGQYIGLIKISKKVISQVREFYHSLDKKDLYDGKDFNNMYMTSFIQLIIDRLTEVKPVFIEGGWFEIDSVEDLRVYENLNII
jgi:choline kinase